MTSRDEPRAELIGARLAAIVRDIQASEPPLGWKQELAEAWGVSPAYITKLLKTPPPNVSRRVMDDVCARIGLSPVYFNVTDLMLKAMASMDGDVERPWERFLETRADRYDAAVDRLEVALAALDGFRARGGSTLDGAARGGRAVLDELRSVPIVNAYLEASARLEEFRPGMLRPDLSEADGVDPDDDAQMLVLALDGLAEEAARFTALVSRASFAASMAKFDAIAKPQRPRRKVGEPRYRPEHESGGDDGSR